MPGQRGGRDFFERAAGRDAATLEQVPEFPTDDIHIGAG
jgi:hypothetical protein